MKSIFPQPDETVILDVLTCNDNNIQKTSEALKEMGFERKDTAKEIKRQAEERAEEERLREEAAAKPPTPPPRLKSIAEKAIRKLLQFLCCSVFLIQFI